MITLLCLIVDAHESAFAVDIDASALVSHSKIAIKKMNENELETINPKQLELYLAKRGNEWLPSRDPVVVALEDGEIPEGISTMLLDGEMEETASIAEVITGLPKLATRQIHVLVKVPKQSEELQSPSFSWRAPRPFLSPAGANWDFQNPLDLDAVSKAIKRHFDAWKRGATDQESRPLFVCVDGAGTGKSRLLNEFPAVVQRLNFSGRGDAKGGGRRSGDKPEMRTLLQNAFTFKVTFTNMTTSQADFADPSHAIGARMLFQLQDDVD
ncbi:hypothetical protein FI667_g3958, partial [Globisporangium splendens]